MPLVTFIDEGIEIEVKEGIKLSDCIRKAGLKIEMPCSGRGKCGKCKVEVFGDLYPKSNKEAEHAKKDNIRIACMAKVKGHIQVKLLGKSKKLKTINNEKSVDIQVDSSIKRIKLLEINEKSNFPYKDSLVYKVNNINLLRTIGILERKEAKEIYGVLYKDKLLDIREKLNGILGVAVDIGTTGVSAHLIDLESGEVVNKISGLNPQTEFGADILSRITFSMEQKDGIDILSKCIREKIDLMIKELIEEKFHIKDVYRVAIAANTTMLHLLLGTPADTIANAPYRPVFLDKLNVKASELGIHINTEGIVTILPSASAYIGADVIAGIMAVDFHKKQYPSIFIDIGTNGEIVALYNGRIVASSTASGPALEGVNIECGMRAEEGAIDTFGIDDDYNVKYSTIGNETAKGICGSGIIDIVTNLLKHNVILTDGKFNNQLPQKLEEKIKDKKFYVSEEIYISQKDIREIQLAKGAVATGINMLLKEISCSIDKVQEVIISGVFGYHINPESIKIIGLIPKEFSGKISFVGNSSVEGARIALINDKKLKLMSDIKKHIKILELSMREDYQENLIKSLNF
ncbi:ASKHA domain-containing protein [Clostridium sp. DJ247]|uniref:ASKHA domain-containing protein n=1 Tax=Clostridium sp. DJ247 TaxID=2726188 RepID=UPI0016263110|nr:ASKHA domain-containing protein [Clostridium sp. DJ247]MBC2581198.1 DUF4445 domain-containing protein [Clostridium sp. DJ247]